MRQGIYINKRGKLVNIYKNMFGFASQEIIDGAGMVDMHAYENQNELAAWLVLDGYNNLLGEVSHYAGKSEFKTLKNR